jgi:hypothetical protein
MVKKSTFNVQDPAVQKHMKEIKTRWKFVLFFLGKLPSLIWFGIRVRSLEHNACSVDIPFTWRTQNPFKSIYFAAQAAAAELCTGFLVTTAIAGRPKMSMLVTGFEIEFLKKATRLTTFSCEEGLAIIETIDKAYSTGEGQSISVQVKGIQKGGELVSRARLTWSFKVKS